MIKNGRYVPDVPQVRKPVETELCKKYRTALRALMDWRNTERGRELLILKFKTQGMCDSDGLVRVGAYSYLPEDAELAAELEAEHRLLDKAYELAFNEAMKDSASLAYHRAVNPV